MFVFVENIGQKYNFQGVGWSLVGSEGWGGHLDPKKKVLRNY